MTAIREFFASIRNRIVMGWRALKYEFGIGEEKD